MVDRGRRSPEDRDTGPGGQTYRSTFDWADPNQPSATLVDVLASIRDADPLDIEPLHSDLDPDALNALFDRPGGSTGTVIVEFDGYEMRIEGEGRIVAEPLSGRTGSDGNAADC